MILSCDNTKLNMAVLTADAMKAAESLRELVERHLPIDAPPSRRRELVRLLGLILDEPHTVPVPACGWSGSTDDIPWQPVARRWIRWTCPRCGSEHEHERAR